MNKKSLVVSSLLLSSLVLAGCFGTKTEEANEFTVASCNDYVKLMRCVAEKSGAGQEGLDAVEQAIAAWKALPENELTQTCNMAIEAASASADAYTQLGCDVPMSDMPQNDMMSGDDAMMSGDMMSGDDTAMMSGTKEDAAVVEAVTSEVTGTTAQ